MATPVGKGIYVGTGRVRLPKVLFGSYTTTERNALTAAQRPEGTVVYDSTLKKLILRNDTTWVNCDGTVLS